MDSIRRILFICKENVCRSIMAEAVMNSVKGDRDLEVESRGLVVLFPEPINPKATAVLKSNGMEPAKSYSQPFIPEEDVTGHTLILTMSEREKKQVLDQSSRFPAPAEVCTLGEFCGKPSDILTPYGGTLADYGAYYEYIDLLVKIAAERIFRSNMADETEG